MYLPANFITFNAHVIRWVFFLLVLCGCTSESGNLVDIDKLIDTNPQKAYDLLRADHIKGVLSKSDSAYYTLLYYKACYSKRQFLSDVNKIDFSISYYQQSGDDLKLGECYYYKAYYLKYNQHFSEACNYYLKSRMLAESVNDKLLLARITYDLANIGFLKADFKYAFEKTILAINQFHELKRPSDENQAKVCLARYFRIKKKYANAFGILSRIKSDDLIVKGVVMQEFGMIFYELRKYQTAQKYFRISLKFPYQGTNYSIRNFTYADLLFDINMVDSADYYAKRSFLYLGTYYGRRDACRIIANCAYTKNDLGRMTKYVSKYQDYSDSVRLIENQEKPSSIETVFSKTKDSDHSHKMLVIVILGVVLVMSGGVVLGDKSYQKRREEASIIDQYKKQITQKSELLIQGLDKKLEIARKQQSSARKKSTSEQRAALDKELYQKALNLDNWDAFSCEMNHAFNNIVSDLENNFSGISQKEIIWCCLDLLNVPVVDRLSVLEATTDSMYKLKQRLAVKLNAKSAKDVDLFLKNYKNADQVG